MAGFTVAIIGAALATYAPVIGSALTFGGATLSLGASFLIRAGVGVALNALSPKPSFTTQAQSRGFSIQGANGSSVDHQIVYGKMRVGGLRVYDESTGTENEYLHRVLAFTGHEIESFEEIWIDDEVATFDVNGFVVTPEKYAGLIRIKQHLGSPIQVADVDLVTESDGLWTANHRLQGVSYLYVRYEYDKDAFAGNLPTISATIKGKKVFDPRTNSTYWTDNAILCLRDYLTSDYGLGLSSSEIDDANYFSPYASIVEAQITDSGQTESLYSCNGSFTTGATPFDIISNLLTSISGILWYSQGTWKVKPAYYTSPVMNFTVSDLRSSFSLTTKTDRRDSYNIVKGTFTGAETDWQNTDYPEVTNASYVTQDNGIESVLNLDLPFTSSSLTCQRLARVALEKGRRQYQVKATFGLRALGVQVGDNISITYSRFGWSEKQFEIQDWEFVVDDSGVLGIQLTLTEIDSGIFTRVDGSAITSPGSIVVADPSVATNITGLSITDTTTSTFSITVSWDTQSEKTEYYQVQYKLDTDTDYTSFDVSSNKAYISGLEASGNYTVRVRSVNVSGARSAWASDSITLTNELDLTGAVGTDSFSISQVTGLQSALDDKAELTGATFTGNVRIEENGIDNLTLQRTVDTEYLGIEFETGTYANFLLYLINDGSGDLRLESRNYDTDGSAKAGVFNVDWSTGEMTLHQPTTVNGLILSTPSAPSSSSDTGTQGEIRWDNNYIYICTATNTWERAPIATW